MVSLRGEVIESNSSFNQAAACKKSKTDSDEIRFLDYLGTDFSYLQRFILASEQMVRLVQTEAARSSPEVQNKIVDTIEIAKDTLSEAGASARPFIACPPHLLHYREAYFNVLSASRSLVPYIEDLEVKLRLRRLLLPLTSTSCFRVVISHDLGRAKADSSANLSTCCDETVALAKSKPSSPGPSKPVVQRRKIRRASATAVVRYTSSSMLHSSRTSNSGLRLFTGRSVTNSRRLKVAPYPRTVASESRSQDHDEPRDHREEGAPVSQSLPPSLPCTSPSPSFSSSEPSTERTSPESPVQSEAPCPKLALPPIQYVSPQTPQALSLLQQQRRDFSAAYRKNVEEISTMPSAMDGDWSAQSRTGLGGIDCNVPDYGHYELPRNVEVFSKEEYDSANENFKKGLGWFPTSWRNERIQQQSAASAAAPTPAPAPASPPELTWNAKWDDTKQATQPPQMVMPALSNFPGEPEQSTPLAETTCMIM